MPDVLEQVIRIYSSFEYLRVEQLSSMSADDVDFRASTSDLILYNAPIGS